MNAVCACTHVTHVSIWSIPEMMDMMLHVHASCVWQLFICTCMHIDFFGLWDTLNTAAFLFFYLFPSTFCQLMFLLYVLYLLSACHFQLKQPQLTPSFSPKALLHCLCLPWSQQKIRLTCISLHRITLHLTFNTVYNSLFHVFQFTKFI